MSLPARIVIVDGALKMRDGTSLRAYLRAFQKKNRIKDGTVMNVVLHSALVRTPAKKPVRYIPVPLQDIQPTDELALAS